MWILLLPWVRLVILLVHAHLGGIVLEGKGQGALILSPVHLLMQVVWDHIGGEVVGFPVICLIGRFCPTL